MESYPENITRPSDFRRKSTLGLALAAVILLSPFSVNNFLQGRYLLGAGSAAVVLILAWQSWAIRNDRYTPMVAMTVLAPAIIVFLLISLRTQGIIGVLWCYPAVLSFYVMLPERKAWIANITLLVVAIPQAWIAIDEPVATRMVATLTAVSIFSAIFVRVITVQQQKLHAIAATDPLTGLYNRTLLDQTLNEAIERSSRTGAPITLLALDLDHFKKINDSLGHEAGDSVLRQVGDILRKRFRRLDRVFRLGGEEFLALLEDTGEDDAVAIADELRRSVSTAELLPGQTITVSIGTATHQMGEPVLEWMKRADANLYEAKALGRNQVVA